MTWARFAPRLIIVWAKEWWAETWQQVEGLGAGMVFQTLRLYGVGNTIKTEQSAFGLCCFSQPRGHMGKIWSFGGGEYA